MRLTDLDPLWMAAVEPYDREMRQSGVPFEQAQGLRFYCPLCTRNNGGSLQGIHQVVCWGFGKGVPDHYTPLPGRWVMSGTGFNDLSLTGPPGHTSSVLLLSGCRWHGFVTNGEVSILPVPPIVPLPQRT